MKKLLFCLLLLAGFTVNAQVYNNEWIDYSKTYYKFKVGKTGLHRIPQATLAAAGLGNTPAEHFQLWRNGVEVPIYTSVQTGSLSTTDYIEFWGEMNDGKPDKQLYRQPEYQLNDKWSLQTDTATYFLTINPSANNLRLTPTANNVAGNTLAPEPYFMHTVGRYFKDRRNAGRGVPVGEILYSSSYDYGEGWSSNDIGLNATLTTSLTNLFVAAGGPDPKIKVAVSGNANNCRRFRLTINSDSVYGKDVNFYNYSVDSTTFPLNSLTKVSTNAASLVLTNVRVCCDTVCHTSDRMVIHQYELTYPRQFNFGSSTNFEFSLSASFTNQYLEIAGFTYGSVPPVLYDITNGKRYIVDISTPSLLKIVLEPSAADRKLVLVSQEAANKTDILSVQSRIFTDYRQAQNQADYIIITNPLLFTASDGSNPVEHYREYRSSVNGGSYNAKVFLIEELVDQFAFGIKKHPLAIRNFLQFARNQFSVSPKHVFLIGKGVNYSDYRGSENNINAEKLNLVPTFGWPASDVLLSADPGDSYPKIPIGRLSVINGQEVAIYLKKVKEFEAAQKVSSPYIKDKAWMKNVVHAVGSSEPGLQRILDDNMNKYKQIIMDTLFGAKVTTFTKTSPDAIQQINSGGLFKLFEEGLSLITYFGHSSATTFEFNLNIPEQYNNTGKYPLFVALGCNAGNFYTFSTSRFQRKETLSELYTLSQDHGTIGFIASSHFGIVHYLDIWNERFYKSISNKDYGKTVGEAMQSAVAQTFAYTTQEDFYARATCEENSLNGDPAIRLNTHERPDYVIEENLVKVNPSFVSVAEPSFTVSSKFMNIGKSISDSIVVQVEREFPDQSKSVVLRQTIPGIRYIDSIETDLFIDPIKDKGVNKITVTIDADGQVDELFETNNSFTKEFVIYEDEARPVYPQNFAIINTDTIKLIVSTANPFSSIKSYKMEIDTTELFNSPIKSSVTKTSVGGIIEFDPGISFVNNTVYYWRVAQLSTAGEPSNWSKASFVYLNGHDLGFNQSHVYQHFKSSVQGIYLDSISREWGFGTITNDITAKNTVFGFGGTQEGNFTVAINGDAYIRSACVGNSLVFNVFDAKTLKPWKNVDASGRSLFLYGSGSASCQPSRNWNFEFSYTTAANRKRMMDFMDAIPEGSYVVVRSFDAPVGSSYSTTWRADTSLYGSGKSLYHKLLEAGFTGIDSLKSQRSWIFIYQKGNLQIQPKFIVSEGLYDQITLSAEGIVPVKSGLVTSPKFGPAETWKQFEWKGKSLEPGTNDIANVTIVGVQFNGNRIPLFSDIPLNQGVVDISGINAKDYPYLELELQNKDSVSFTPYQLEYWRLTYTPVPEGAVAPNIYLSLKDTFEVGEPFVFKLAFKNISDKNFDSLKVKVVVTDQNNGTHEIPMTFRPLPAFDTLHIDLPFDTRQFRGLNTLFVDINPDNDQPEQYHFNNFIYRNFYVKADTLNPLLDVTFDHEHILNGDIVSAKPEILIKLKDEAKWMLIDTSSLVSVKLLYPFTTTPREIHFDNDTLRFNKAQQTTGTDHNTAIIQFNPYLQEDGDYELIVSATDKSENQAGVADYKVKFKVINRPMISNMLNYPNPFTSSTAFVFTITGSEVPQNLKIQILTVTGKVVREITKEDLGPLRIGRNITEYKWDGTDQYGQKLANGVYLYRVVSNLNGKSLEKYRAENEDTDVYFNKGYGKMYLMR